MKRIVALVVTGAFLLFAQVQHLIAQEVRETTKISVNDIGRSVTLIGRLGKPIGTMMTLRGIWKLPTVSKDGTIHFYITHVDGAKLTKPVIYDDSDVTVMNKQGNDVIPSTYSDSQRLLHGVTWNIRAYETGGFRGAPMAYYEEFGGVPQTKYWGKIFTSRIVGILQETPKPLPLSKTNRDLR